MANADVSMASLEATPDLMPLPSDAEPQSKKQKMTRRDKQRKAALCKHFDKPDGCPFPNCRFAHGRDDVADDSSQTLAAQRKFIREQVASRSEGRFTDKGKAETSFVARQGTMIERYYTQLFACDVMGRPNEDQYVHMHSNRLCVVGVAGSHPVMNEQIETIEFTNHVMESKVSGKKKRGGQFLLPHAILCHIRCKSGNSYAIRSCIRGTLLEVNDSLLENPKLVQEKHLSDGYLIIVQPKVSEIIEIQDSLLSEDEYKQYRVSREQPTADLTVDCTLSVNTKTM